MRLYLFTWKHLETVPILFNRVIKKYFFFQKIHVYCNQDLGIRRLMCKFILKRIAISDLKYLSHYYS